MKNAPTRNRPGRPDASPGAPDQELLTGVRLATTDSLELTFADGLQTNLPVGDLGMPVDRIRWDTVGRSPDGKALTVTAIKGEAIPIQTTTLRYLVDVDYAAKVDAKVDALQLLLDNLDGDGQPPAGLFDRPEQDPVLDSWK